MIKLIDQTRFVSAVVKELPEYDLLLESAVDEHADVGVTAIVLSFNEERCIERCIRSIDQDCFSEILVVDSGSSDDTWSILQVLTEDIPKLRIIQSTWEKSFARARNNAMEAAINDWVFFVDADEYLDSDSKFITHVLSHVDRLKQELVICPTIKDVSGHEILKNPRIYNKSKGYRYYGSVHEELRAGSHYDQNLPKIGVNISLGHDGYTAEVLSKKNKARRNISLLKANIKDEPNNPIWKLYLARDGKTVLTTHQIINLCLEAKELSLNKDTLFYNYCLSWALHQLIEAYINNNNIEQSKEVLEVIYKYRKLFDESDIFYHEMRIKLAELRNTANKCVDSIYLFKDGHRTTKSSFIHSGGDHLEKLLNQFKTFSNT